MPTELDDAHYLLGVKAERARTVALIEGLAIKFESRAHPERDAGAKAAWQLAARELRAIQEDTDAN